MVGSGRASSLGLAVLAAVGLAVWGSLDPPAPTPPADQQEPARAAAGMEHRASPWQRDPDGGETVLRYVRDQLGWSHPRLLDLTVPEYGGPWLRRWRVIRCAAGVSNPSYPELRCAPPDGRTYPAVFVSVQLPPGHSENGLWTVTRVEPTVVHQPEPTSRDEVRGFVAEFLERRVRGSGAEDYLSPQAEEEFRQLGLSPLYGPPDGFPYRGHEIAFVDGPLWPGGSFEVGTRIILASGSALEETLFVGPASNRREDGTRLLVLGGRRGLTGP